MQVRTHPGDVTWSLRPWDQKILFIPLKVLCTSGDLGTELQLDAVRKLSVSAGQRAAVEIR